MILTLDEKGVGGWCQVDLLIAVVRRSLGAERVKYIAARLASFLADTSPRQRWVLSLSELHTSAYGEHVAAETVLHLQGADAKMFARLVLTPAEKSRWMQELAQYM